MAEPVRSKDKPISRSPRLARGARITGEQRGQLADCVSRRYQAGESIRSIAEDLGRSYGFVQSLLTQAEVSLRSRGGDTRGADAVARRALVTERVRKVRAQLADDEVRAGSGGGSGSGGGGRGDEPEPTMQPKVAKKAPAAADVVVKKPSKHSHRSDKDSAKAEKPAKSEKKKKKKKSKKDKHKDQ